MKQRHSILNFNFFYNLVGALIICFGFIIATHAQDEVESEDNYDPFSDYTEFSEASSEEADINFFRNGRLLNIGLTGGFTGFTGGYSKLYSTAPTFGVFVTYFFSLQFAFQMGLTSSDHNFSFKALNGDSFNAKMRLFDINLHGKYFFNTQNMTRAFAEWNPYVIGGISQIRRSHSTTSVVRATDNAQSFDIGGGVEYMFNKKKNFVGFVLLYQYANFSGEGSNLPDPNGEGSGYTNYSQSGDPISFMTTIGINY
jgi:hypothetical protein